MKEEFDAANLLLREAGEDYKFTLEWKRFKFKLKIKPVTTLTLIKISREVSQIKEFNPTVAMFDEQIKNSDSFVHVCKTLTVATETRFPWLVNKAIMDLPFKKVLVLWSILMKQSDPTCFFFILASAKGMNKMISTKESSKKGKPKVVTQSSGE